MDAPHDDLTSKWGALGAIGTAVAAMFAYLRAIDWRKKEQNPDPEREPISLRSLDKKVRDHDNRLDGIDLLMADYERKREHDHNEIMQTLRRIVSGTATE